MMPPWTAPWIRARTRDRPETVAIHTPGVLDVNVAAEPPAMGVQGSGYHSVPFSVASNSTTPDVSAGAALGDDDGETDADGLALAEGEMDAEADGLMLADPEGLADADGLMDADPDGLALPLGVAA
jgi:hypothetical protein